MLKKSENRQNDYQALNIIDRNCIVISYKRLRGILIFRYTRLLILNKREIGK